MRLVYCVLLALGCSAIVASQAEFDAASIRLVADSESRSRAGMGEKSPGTFFAENMPLHVLIEEAYGNKAEQSWIMQSMAGRQRSSWESLRILNEPAWVGSDRFDVMAKSAAGGTVGARTQEQMMKDQTQMDLMLRRLLEERFHLKAHREMKTLPVYELVVSKPGLLKQGNCGAKCRTSEFGQKGVDFTINGDAMNVTELSGTIAMVLDRPVIDRTGVTGTFDVHLRWTPDAGELGDSGATSFDKSSGSIFSVLQEQLGLKLQKASGPVEVLVIDHVEKLAEN